MGNRKQWVSCCLITWLLLFGIAYATAFSGQKAYADGRAEITGFAQWDLMAHSVSLPFSGRPSEGNVIARMPKTLGVYLNGASKITEIPVSWFCVGDDYGTSKEYYLMYSPMWDESRYSLKEGLDVTADAPFFSVFFNDEKANGTLAVDPVQVCTNMNTCYKWLKNNTPYKLAAICGILANIQTECSFNPKLLDGGAYGLIQWMGSRLTGLKTYCSKNGLDYQSINGQLAYMQDEIVTNSAIVHKGIVFYELLKSVDNCELGSVYTAWAFAHYYERCAIQYYQKRQALARLYWQYFTSSDFITDPKLKASGISFPDKIGKPDSYALAGKVSSSGTITKIKVRVAHYESYASITDEASKVPCGKWVTDPATIAVTVDGTSYDLSKITQQMKFSGLTAGKTYIFSIVAYVKGYGHTLYEKRFTVNNSHCYTPTITEPKPTDTVAPVAPAAPTLKAVILKEGIKLTWGGVTGATKYYIYRKTGSGSYVKLASKGSSARIYTDTTAVAGVKYTYGVKASNGSWTTKRRVVILPFIKSIKPTVHNDENGLEVSWSTLKGITGYYVYRKVKGGSYKRIAICGATSTTYTDLDAVSGKTYVYAVTGYYKGTNTYRAVRIGATRMRLATIKPTLSNRSTGIKLSWSKVEGALEYKIYRAAEGGSLVLLKTVSASASRSYIDTQVVKDNGAQYIYAVKAVNGSHGSYRFSRCIYRVTGVQMTGLVNKSPLSVQVNWFYNNHASGYQIQYATNSSMTRNAKKVLATGRKTEEKLIANLTKGTTYYVRIRAYLTAGGKKYYSAWGDIGSVIIKK